MKISELAKLLFTVDQGFYLFDDADEVEISNAAQADSDELLLQMPDMRLDLQFGDTVWAVASSTLPIEEATVRAENGDEVFGIYVLHDPVIPKEVPEAFDADIPVGVAWKFTDQDTDYHEFSDLLARVSEVVEEEVDDVEDTVDEVPVSVPDVDEDEGGTTPPAEDKDEVDDAVPMMNDAEILGADHPEMQELLQKPFTFMSGNMYGQKDRRNTQDGDWVRTEMSLLAWMLGQDKSKNSWGLTRHPEAKSKEGSSLVLASAIGGARRDAAIETMSCIGLDIDSGAALDDVIAKLEELNLFSIVYTSFSHGKSTLVLKHDDIMRKLKLDESPNRTQVQIYMREHHKDRYDESFIKNIEIEEARKQTPDGLRVILKTPPLDKFRVIIPLWESVNLADLAPTVTGWKDIWADAVTGVAVNMLGVNFDATSCDVNRLFFTPRHPADADDWYCCVVQGRPLRFEEIEPSSKNQYVKNRDPGDPFAMGTDPDGELREVFQTACGVNLNQWHKTHKDRWLAADVIETFCADKIRVSGGEKVGTVHLECPFEHEHSSEGGTATMAMNPDANSEHGYWTVFCKHDSCQGRDKLEFVKQMIDDGWFEAEVLYAEEWNLGEADAIEEVLEEETPEEKAFTPVEQAAKFTKESSDEEILKFMKKQLKLKADTGVRGGITEVLAANTNLGKSDLNRFWKQLISEQDQKAREKASENDATSSTVPIVNDWDFDEMVEWGNKRIQDVNAKNPRLFHYIDDVARIEETADGMPRIRMLAEKEFAAEFNDFTTWLKVTFMGDVERRRKVPADLAVVSHLFHSAHTVYPKLRGLVTTPTFSRSGEMISTPGFHSSGLYYWNTGNLDVPSVSDAPSEEEVNEAKRLLVEEVFADFPLGGLVRDEIVKKALHGEGVPAVTNLISMVLLMFCRDMVAGPTPGHLMTKPSPGTGASLLVDVVSLLVNGEATAALSIPSSKEEMQKTLITILSDGSNIIYFDNIDQSIDSGELASAMTSPKYKARQLGKSQSIETEVRAVFMLCGNNVRMSPELIRRLLMIDLDANMANPEKRSGWRHEDIKDYVLKNRGDLVWACLTLIQNWVAKGMKGDSSAILNSYENWSRVMGGIMRDAGMGGFLANRDELKERATDGGEDDITLFLDAWWNQFMVTPVLLRDPSDNVGLIDMALAEDLSLPVRMKRSVDDTSTYDPKRFAEFLGKYEGRVMPLTDGTEVRVVRGKRTKKGVFWQLEVIKEIEDAEIVGNVEV